LADANNPISDATAAPRLARLDGLRGIAACGVAFTYHAWALFRDDAFAPGNPLVEWLHWSGWLFVDMFFVLSGYIFAHVYLSRGLLGTPRGLADFAVARFARLYPLHLVMLLLTAALFWGKPENTPLAFLAHLAMLQALVPPVAQTFDGPTWSLSVEAVCYMLFAVGAAAGPQALRRVTLFAILLGVAALALHAAPYGPFVRDNFPRGLLGFFLGQALWHQRARLAQVPGSALALLIVAGFAVPPSWFGAILPLVLIAFPAMLVLGLRLAWLESRPLLWLGDRSYAIYLIHVPLRDLLVAHNGVLDGDPVTAALGWAGFVVATLVLADLSLRLVENPARRAIRVWWQQRPLRAVVA
jgi:peptidoglycan/LPS O-acetylase OafA/YrhL